MIERLERAFGQFGGSRHARMLEGDPKGEAVLRVSFDGSEGIDVHLPLDGTKPIRVEGYGHATRSGCQQSAVVVSQVLADLMAVTPPRVDAVPRTGPQLAQRPQRAVWEGMANRLATLRSKL